MKRMAVVTIGLLAGVPAFGQVTPAVTQRPQVKYEMRRDLTTEQAVFAKSDEIGATLQPTARIKRDQAAKRVRTQLATAPGNVDPFVLAQQEVRRQFGAISEDQANVLSFSVLAEATRAQKAHDGAPDSSDSMTEMSDAQSLRLQMMMDKRSKVMSTLSNMLKKVSDTQSSLTQNIK